MCTKQKTDFQAIYIIVLGIFLMEYVNLLIFKFYIHAQKIGRNFTQTCLEFIF